jgi:thiol-disulfide isomerase/thioredoxin
MKTSLLFLSILTFNFTVFAQFTADMNFTSSEDQIINPSSILANGQYIYLDFFSTTCGACNSVAPEVNNAYETYGNNNQNVFFIGVDNFSSAADCINFSNSHNSEFPVIAGQEGGSTIFSLFNQTGYPRGILINPSGEVVTIMTYSSIAILTESLASFVSPTNDCDLIEVMSIALNTETNLIELSINANTPYLYGYPSFALYNNQGDTLAMEQVNYYGLSGESIHYLEVYIPLVNWESELTLKLYSGFYELLECTYTLNASSIDVIGCTNEQATNFNNTATINDASCLYTADYFEVYIDLNSGWNLVGFSCADPINTIDAFSPYTDNVVIVKDYLGTAYLPEYGFNGIGDLEKGYGYQLKINEAIEGFNLCNP